MADEMLKNAQPQELESQIGEEDGLKEQLLRMCRQNKLAAFSAVLILVVILIAIFAPVLAPYGEAEQDLISRLQGPSAAHWFGTDELGRDVFSRILYGSRLSLTIGILPSIISLVVGIFFGLLAGYFGGWVDYVIMRLADIMLSIPSLLLAMVVGGVFAGPAQDTGRVTYEYGLTNKELFLAGLSNTTSVGLIFAGLVVGVLQIVGFIFDVMGDAADGAVESALVFAGSQASAYLIGAVSAGVIVLVLVLWVLSAVGSCIGYGGFKARRRNNRIEVEYGLLQHTFQGIDIDRVQSVVVKQSFIRRLLGYCELSLGKIDAGTDEDSSNQKNTLANQGIIIHPFVKMNRVPEILAGLVPEFSDLPQEAKPVAKVALRRAVLRQSIWFGGGFWLAVVVTVCLVVFGWVNGEVATGGIELDSEDLFLLSIGWNVIVVGGYALAAILFVIDVVNAVLWARESSFAYNHRFMQVSNGGLSRETVSFPRQKIQFGCTKSNPLQRRAGTDTLLATTAAGSGGTTTTLIDASHADAMAWLDWLKPGGNQ